jgi:hypothetical protein
MPRAGMRAIAGREGAKMVDQRAETEENIGTLRSLGLGTEQ